MLDSFDLDYLEQKGAPQDVLRSFLGVRVKGNNAQKYITGINHYLRVKRNATPNESGELDRFVIRDDGFVITQRELLLSEEDAKNPTRVMMLMGFDPLMWSLVKCEMDRKRWNVTMKIKDENGVQTPHKETNAKFGVKLTVKPLQSLITSEGVLDFLYDFEPPELPKYKYKQGNLMLELPIMDLHLAKLAWGEETGDDYDLKIASQLFKDTVLDILSKVEHLSFEKIVVQIGQDFFHMDNPENATTKGTTLDVDSRWQKMFNRGVELWIWAIELLRAIAPVEVIHVSGNHDKVLSYCLAAVVKAYYTEIKAVEVDISPTPRKYIRYGVNLIGLSHGKEGKRIQHNMQQERPQDWGETLFREWHLGDLHHEESMEIGGIIIRRISSVTATDAWHAEKGYKAIRKAQAFVWDKEKGRQLIVDSNVIV